MSVSLSWYVNSSVELLLLPTAGIQVTRLDTLKPTGRTQASALDAINSSGTVYEGTAGLDATMDMAHVTTTKIHCMVAVLTKEVHRFQRKIDGRRERTISRQKGSQGETSLRLDYDTMKSLIDLRQEGSADGRGDKPPAFL